MAHVVTGGNLNGGDEAMSKPNGHKFLKKLN